MSAIAPLEISLLQQPRTQIERLLRGNFCGDSDLGAYHPSRTKATTILTASIGAATLLAIPAQLPVCIKIAGKNLALQYIIGAASIIGNFRNTAEGRRTSSYHLFCLV